MNKIGPVSNTMNFPFVVSSRRNSQRKRCARKTKPIDFIPTPYSQESTSSSLAPLPLFAIAITASASASAQQQVVFDVASSSTSAAAAAAVEDSLLFQAKLIRAAAAAKCTLVGDGIQRSAQTHQTVRRKQR